MLNALSAADLPGQRLTDAYWESTPLGSQATWSQPLRSIVSVIRNSGFPMLIWWGAEHIQLYNDAYIRLFGKRHPAGFGQRGPDCWPEIWPIIGPMIDRVRLTGDPFSAQDMLFTLERNGFAEEAYFTFSYSRVDGYDAADSGVLCACNETTTAVLRERNFRMMADTIANVIYTHASDGTVEWANSRWYDYSGLPPEIALTPEGWARVMPAADYDRLLCVLGEAFAAGNGYETEVRFKPDGGADAAYRWFLLRAVPMHAPDGTLLRWAGSATDVHDSRVAAELLRVQLEREHQASRAFQTAALPQILPTIAGLALSAVYEPAGAQDLVGGDWFDAFRLPDGRVVLSVGDVMGSGLSAAITMAAVRQAIRGAAHVFPEPAAVLDAADHALRSEQADRIVTAFVGVLDPLTLILTYASAGHPAPLVRFTDGTICELSAVDFPLGLRNEEGRQRGANGSIALRDKSLLVLYTDGLIESTRDALAGEQRLRTALGTADVYDAENPAAAIRTLLPPAANDDVAILAVRIAAEADTTGSHPHWKFQADDADTAMRTRRQIGAELQRLGATVSEADDAELIFGELIGNVVRHTGGNVEAALDLSGDSPVLHVLDRGPGFTFYARLPKDTMSESGRGLYITSMLARDVSVIPRSDGDGGSHARAVLAMRLRRAGSP